MIEPDTPLAEIAVALDSAGANLDFFRGDAEVPFERLNVLLQSDDAGRDYVLQIVFVDDVSELMAFAFDEAIEDEDEDEVDETAVTLHFSLILPYRVKDGCDVEIMRLLMTINRLLPLGVFGYGETDQGLYWGYPLLLADRDSLQGLVLEDTLNMLNFALETYGTLIEAVAIGSASYSDVLDQLKDADTTLPPVGEPPVMSIRKH